MQWPHMVPVHPAETGPGDPLACFPASGRTSWTGRAISDRSFPSTLWGHQQPPGPWSSRQQRAPLPPPLLAAPSAPPLPPAGLAPAHPGLNRAGGSWTQPAQSVGWACTGQMSWAVFSVERRTGTELSPAGWSLLPPAGGLGNSLSALQKSCLRALHRLYHFILLAEVLWERELLVQTHLEWL